jgi:hypothetical protein
MLLVGGPWRHGHQAEQPQVRAFAHRRDQIREVLPGAAPAFGLLGRQLDFQHDVEGLPASLRRRASFGESTVWMH